MQPDDRLSAHEAYAVLDDAAHEPGLNCKELARDARLGNLRLDLVGDAIELPTQRVCDHCNRLGKADVPYRPLLHPFGELLAREARPDLLLERQAPDARVLDAVDGDAVHALAHAGQCDRQCVHDEAGVHARAEHRHPCPFRRNVDGACQPALVVPRVGQLLGRRHDGFPRLQDCLNLWRDRLQRRTGAEQDHIRRCPFERRVQVAVDPDPQLSIESDNLTKIAS